MIRFEIDVPPSTNNLYVNAGNRRVKSAAYRRWLEAAGWEVKAQAQGRKLDAPWRLSITANIRSVRDISNIIKPVEDLVVKLKLAPDDRFCRKVEAIRDESIPSGRAIVTIEEVGV